ncbi:hypothetical protein EJB05_50561 [Eragrostis curvula]|uniref:Uncharacterized protein n=1 Tax=Eragrostis curvula TaxID=38414 RepID=A0A5J9SXW9_9POAL|nr:hypothetical protein EJB05_50561 [Eragrostis curvula]
MEVSGGGRSRLRALGFALAVAVASVEFVEAAAITRRDFPEGFVFGAGSSAFQVEGAWNEDGKKPSIWDTYGHGGYAPNHATADVAADQYHKYKACFLSLNSAEDVKLMHEMGLEAYRFSIAWPRIIPDGRGAVNPKGLEYYNNLIDELLSYGIQPHATIYHFDLPQALQDEYNGLLSPRFMDDFTAYAEVCFRSFGDRVKHWTTLNEPNIEPLGGYDLGFLPPRRCSSPFGDNCAGGNSTTEPYIVGHHLLLAHASAVSLYRDKYQAVQGGQIGLTLLAFWFEPSTQEPKDVAAAKRMTDFFVGWFMHPLVYGDYPLVMRRNAGSKLPTLTAEESMRVRGSFDFMGINHYGAIYVEADLSQLKQALRDYTGDTAAKFVTAPFQSSGNQQDKLKVYVYLSKIQQLSLRLQNHEAPWALLKLLDYVKVKYRNPPVVIYENGAGHKPDPSGGSVYDDEFRSHYLQVYIEATLLSIRNGSNVHGYFVWSFLDVFELLFGYNFQFGLYGVDFGAEGRTRYARHSARWYAGFLHGGELRLAMRSPSSIRAYSE